MSSTVLQGIAVDNGRGVSLSNALVEIPLSSSLFTFSSLAPDGSDLDILDSDGATSISHSLRNWNSEVGLRLVDTWLAPPSDGTHSFVFAGQLQVGDIGLPNGPHTLWAAGSALNDPSPVYGELFVYDKNHNLVWSYQAPTKDYVMSCTLGDVNGDGVNEIAVGFRNAEQKAYILKNDGTVLWSFHGPNGVPNGYIRTATIGKLRNDLPGSEVVFGTSGGSVSLCDHTGTQLWTKTLTYSSGLHTIQAGIIDDLDLSGQGYIYCTQSTYVVKIDSLGNIIWSVSPLFGNIYSSYAIASGHITSTSTKQIVTSASVELPGATNAAGFVACLDINGNVLWTRMIPYPSAAISCGDVNGDGYDEVIVGWGTTTSNTTTTGWGGILVLDRNGNELACTSIPTITGAIRFADYDGSGTKAINVSCRDMRLFRYKWNTGVNAGGTVKAIIPSLGAGAAKTIYLARATSGINPPIGDCTFDLSGDDGSTPPDGDVQGGSWTIQSHRLTSRDSGNTSAAEAFEYTSSSCDSFELEFDARKPAQGDGTAADYYVGVRYRCNTWGTQRPNGYLLIVGAKGIVNLTRTQTTVGNVATVYSTASSGLTFGTSDVVRLRVVVASNDHSCSYSLNGGPWKILYAVQDTSGSPVTTPGTIAFVNNRGQSQYSSIVLKSIPSAYTVDSSGPGPVLTLWPAASISGPSDGTAGTQTGRFDVDLTSAALSDTVITMSGTLAGDQFEATLGGPQVSSVTIAAGQTRGSFYLTPGTAGTDLVSFVTAPATSYFGAPVSVDVSSPGIPFVPDPSANYMLLESSGYLLLELSDSGMLLETFTGPPPPPFVASASSCYLLLESGGHVVLEDGQSAAKLEAADTIAAYLLTEDGFHFLLEDGGGSIAIESQGAAGNHLGRFRLGDVVPISFAIANPDSYPEARIAAPYLLVHPYSTDGMNFLWPLLIDSDFSLGVFVVTCSYSIGGISGSTNVSFDVVAGGDPGSRVISLFSYERPESRYVLAQLQAGSLVQGSNPHP
jgi:hypothetical protein